MLDAFNAINKNFNAVSENASASEVQCAPSQGFTVQGALPEDFRESLVLDVGHMSYASRGRDEESELQICCMFTRNIAGATMVNSQYGKGYLSWRMSCPSSFEKAMGTERAHQALRDAAIEQIEPFKGKIAIWRVWPRIERAKNGELGMLMRFHLMTEEAYQKFVG